VNETSASKTANVCQLKRVMKRKLYPHSSDGSSFATRRMAGACQPGGGHAHLKFWPKPTHPLQKRRISINFRSHAP